MIFLIPASFALFALGIGLWGSFRCLIFANIRYRMWQKSTQTVCNRTDSRVYCTLSDDDVLPEMSGLRLDVNWKDHLLARAPILFRCPHCGWEISFSDWNISDWQSRTHPYMTDEDVVLYKLTTETE